ncbi:heavy metal translocating P-type ATPase [Tuwongella immobilis]|nr:heavy metal translocating P-type ATPase [Tuwongella immobilis]
MTVLMLTIHGIIRLGLPPEIRLPGLGVPIRDIPLLLALLAGGGPLVWGLLGKLRRGEFGSDLLAGMSILTAIALGEYLAGTIVVLMLSGGEALEAFAIRQASSVLDALARRMPTLAHRHESGTIHEIPLDTIQIGDTLEILPHDICPVDGTVIAGHGVMDESFLTGEPYQISKAPGSKVISGALNGQHSLTIRADRLPIDSRYANIMKVMRASEQQRPQMRRVADRLGAWYTPMALLLAGLAWLISGESVRFLAVLVVATPCPLLIAIPVAIIGAISLSARRGIIIRDPSILETLPTCTTAIFDKTGTLTAGEPTLTKIELTGKWARETVLRRVGALEQYSKHPLARAVLRVAEAEIARFPVPTQVSEPPGQGMTGTVEETQVIITNRAKARQQFPQMDIPPTSQKAGLECLVVMDDRLAAILRFRDRPRHDSAKFVAHLRPKHALSRTILLSGDRESEVVTLADQVGIDVRHFGKSPEEKWEIVREETQNARTMYLGDGINDAPALAAATVGIAFGTQSDITSEAAGAVILDRTLVKVDELMHISKRLRRIALQSAVGGMTLSIAGMALAATGYLTPVMGAIAQEGIDLIAVLNALRMAWLPRRLQDYDSSLDTRNSRSSEDRNR